MINENKPIFALDIGTRSVVGLILYKQSTGYHVKDIIRKEHKERSMLDGQIHNIIAVSDVILEIKEKLEEKHGPLPSVSVAAAGRSLKTMRGKETISLKDKLVFTQEDVFHLELMAVQKAQYSIAKELNQEEILINDYCVGYSVVDYHLDGERIGNLVEQKGEEASVEVIATFLPKVVVESMLSALQRSNLELEALTLEPIAAINVLIPSSMRRLNVALVDIGAGTSDIAITKDGTVTAYGMVPVAGDEITDALSDHFLLDFPEAEAIKRELNHKEEVVLKDILGMESQHKSEEIIDPIDATIDSLASDISDEILHLNQVAPKAVMLIGGGSLTPRLKEKIAEKLSLPVNRVAVRGIDALKDLTYEKELDSTPELVTPIGIAITANESPVEYMNLTVNDHDIRLFDIKKLTVGDSLLSSGIDMTKLYGRPGMALMVTVNNKIVSIPGIHGTAPEIMKNGERAKLDDPIKNGDHIFVEAGVDGRNAEATIVDLFKDIPIKSVIYQGQLKELEPIILQNNETASLGSLVSDRDHIRIYAPITVDEVLSQLEPAFNKSSKNEINVFLNNNKLTVPLGHHHILLNDEPTTLQSYVNDGDRLIFHHKGREEDISLQEVLIFQDIPLKKEINVTFNQEPVHLEKWIIDVYRDGEILRVDSLIHEGDKLSFITKQDIDFIFQDVFAKVNVIRPPEGEVKRPIILRNGEETTFSTTIIHGDELALQWADS